MCGACGCGDIFERLVFKQANFFQFLRNPIVRLECCLYFADFSQSFSDLSCDVMQGHFRSCYEVMMLRHIVRTVLASFTAAATFSLITST
jgi:hypothetical protein